MNLFPCNGHIREQFEHNGFYVAYAQTWKTAADCMSELICLGIYKTHAHTHTHTCSGMQRNVADVGKYLTLESEVRLSVFIWKNLS